MRRKVDGVDVELEAVMSVLVVWPIISWTFVGNVLSATRATLAAIRAAVPASSATPGRPLHLSSSITTFDIPRTVFPSQSSPWSCLRNHNINASPGRRLIVHFSTATLMLRRVFSSNPKTPGSGGNTTHPIFLPSDASLQLKS